jgi:hypothetical protein
MRKGNDPAGEGDMHPPNGPELSCPAAPGPLPTLYGNLMARASDTFSHASRVSCSELLAGGKSRAS